jgi:transposase
MKEMLNIETERVDDIPLLLAHIQRMNIAELLDKHIPVHGNRKGLSLGNVMVVWLSHILSETNHRMNQVQDWSKRRKEVVRSRGLSTFEDRDMTDDRLADVLRALSSDIHWSAFEQELMGNLVRVYDLQKECIRVDTTTVSSYAEVNEEGLLQLGYSKDHRPDLAQLKVVLACLDPLGMPLATEVRITVSRPMTRRICLSLREYVRDSTSRDCCMSETGRWQHYKHVQVFNSMKIFIYALFHLYKCHPINCSKKLIC